MTEKETWENGKAGPIYIRTFHRGEERMSKVPSGGRVSITPEEREMNQVRVMNDGQDFFTNGDLVPVRLVESAEDYEELASNPNLLGESELRDLFSLKVDDFKDKVGEIQNLRVVERLIDIADEVPSVAKSKLVALNDKREELTPKLGAIDPEIDLDEGQPVE